MPGLILGFLGVGRAVMSWLSRRSLAELACIALVLFAGVQTLRLGAEQRQNAKLKAQVVKCAQARQTDQNAYRKAQEDAAANNKAHVQQIEKTYQENSDNAKDAYLRDLAELRRLRGKGTAAPQSAPSGTGSPAPDHATPRIDEAGLCVPATSDVCEAGAEIELRLMHAQNLLLQQSAVDPNSPPAR